MTKKKIKNTTELNKLISKIKNKNNQFNQIINFDNNNAIINKYYLIKYNYNENALIINTNVNNNPINIYGIFLQYIKIPQILIISVNINYAKLLLDHYKNKIKIKINLFLFNIINISDISNLKEQYFDYIDIYYIGYKLNSISYNIINQECNDKKFNSIILDIGTTSNINNYHENALIIILLIINSYLFDEGSIYIYSKLFNLDEDATIFNYLIYTNFIDIYPYNNKNLYYGPTIPCSYIYTKYIKNNNNSNINIKLIELLEKQTFNLDTTSDINFLKEKYKISKLYINYIKILYKIHYVFLANNLNTIKHLTDINLSNKIIIKQDYYNNKFNIDILYIGYNLINNNKLLTIPVFLHDIPENNNILNIKVPLYSWLDKSYLLSDIQFLTMIAKKVNLLDYVVIYIGCYKLNHLNILFKLFNVQKWLLYDNKPFKYFKSNNKISLFDTLLSSNIVSQLKKTYKNIIFISNNNHVLYGNDRSPDHMINQVRLSIGLNAKYILLNCNFPINQVHNDKYLYSINDLMLERTVFSNSELATDLTSEFLYIKGEILLPLYQAQSNKNLRLFIERKDQYELEIYKLDKIHKLLNFYQITICNTYNYFVNDTIVQDYIQLIPGFDTTLQCRMEYNIFNNYLQTLRDKNDAIKTIKYMYDINLELEKITKQKFINFKYIDHLFYYGYIWRHIREVNKNMSAKIQYKIISNYDKNILGEERTNKSLETIKNSINESNDYYIIK